MSWVEGTGNVFDELTTIQEGIEDTKVALPTAADSLSEFPHWINYLRSGEFIGQSKGWGIGTHTIVSELHIMRGSLPLDEAVIRPYLRPYYTALHNDPTLGDTITQVLAIRYRFIGWEYSPKEKHVGIEFEIDIEVKESTS